MIITIFTVESTGRRKGLFLAFSGQAILSTLILILAYVEQTTSNVSKQINLAYAVGALAILFSLFSGSASGLTWLYQVEFNAWSFRMAGSALATTVTWIGALTCNYSFPLFIVSVRGYVGVFVGVNILVIVSIYLLCPETGSRSLEWLDWHFSDRPPIVVCRHHYLTRVRWTRMDEEMLHTEPLDSS